MNIYPEMSAAMQADDVDRHVSHKSDDAPPHDQMAAVLTTGHLDF